MSDSEVQHPSHYNFGGIEVLDAIESWGLNHNLSAAIIYIARCEHKGQRLKDLKKAEFYIHREIQRTKYPELTSKQADEREREEQELAQNSKQEYRQSIRKLVKK